MRCTGAGAAQFIPSLPMLVPGKPIGSSQHIRRMDERMGYIALLGEHESSFTPHVATGIATRHSSAILGTAIKIASISKPQIKSQVRRSGDRDE